MPVRLLAERQRVRQDQIAVLICSAGRFQHGARRKGGGNRLSASRVALIANNLDPSGQLGGFLLSSSRGLRWRCDGPENRLGGIRMMFERRACARIDHTANNSAGDDVASESRGAAAGDARVDLDRLRVIAGLRERRDQDILSADCDDARRDAGGAGHRLVGYFRRSIDHVAPAGLRIRCRASLAARAGDDGANLRTRRLRIELHLIVRAAHNRGSAGNCRGGSHGKTERYPMHGNALPPELLVALSLRHREVELPAWESADAGAGGLIPG